MDAAPSALRSGRRWSRGTPPPPEGPKPPDASNADEVAVAPGSPSTRGTATPFSCGVCVETARDPVVTRCGHLFCWPCLYRWVVRRHRRPRRGCPVCKSAVAVEPGHAAGVTPIYGVEGGLDGGGGGGGGGVGDLAREEVPPRPRGLLETSEGEELQEFREGLRDLSRDVDALEERMWRVMALVAQLRVPVLIAYAAEIARQNATAGSSSAVGGRRRRRRRRGVGVLGMRSDSSDGGGDGVYRGTRSRRRQANL